MYPEDICAGFADLEPANAGLSRTSYATFGQWRTDDALTSEKVKQAVNVKREHYFYFAWTCSAGHTYPEQGHGGSFLAPLYF